MAGKLWTRGETLVAFNLYCRTPFGRLWHGNPEIIEVAASLGRTPGSVTMKCCNLAAYDATHQARGVSGLKNTSKLDRELFGEFLADPEAIALAAEEAYARVMSAELRQSETVEWEDVQGLDRQSITKVRVNQHFFRSLILASYRSQCAVCELPLPELLVASHIVPWSVDRSLRMNPANGICLCSLHDRAFDTGILSITPEYTITIRADILKLTKPPAIGTTLTQYDNESIHLPDRWQPDFGLVGRRCQ